MNPSSSANTFLKLFSIQIICFWYKHSQNIGTMVVFSMIYSLRVFAKNRLILNWIRFWSLLILLLSVAYIFRFWWNNATPCALLFWGKSLFYIEVTFVAIRLEFNSVIAYTPLFFAKTPFKSGLWWKLCSWTTSNHFIS